MAKEPTKQKSFVEIMRSQRKYSDPAMREVAKGSLKERPAPAPSAQPRGGKKK
jgi:hypothetical protein